MNVRIILENGGRPSGEADVEFATHEEAVKAMCKVYLIFFCFFILLNQKYISALNLFGRNDFRAISSCVYNSILIFFVG